MAAPLFLATVNQAIVAPKLGGCAVHLGNVRSIAGSVLRIIPKPTS